MDLQWLLSIPLLLGFFLQNMSRKQEDKHVTNNCILLVLCVSVCVFAAVSSAGALAVTLFICLSYFIRAPIINTTIFACALIYIYATDSGIAEMVFSTSSIVLLVFAYWNGVKFTEVK